MGEPFRVRYCRCSTDEQDVEIQIEQLLTLGVPRERIFIDKGFSGTTSKNRTGLDNALAAVTSAAAAITGRSVVLTATKFDRFARDMTEAGQILTSLRERGVLFGHLRTREGMAKARAKGRLKGKQPKLPLTARKAIHRRYHDPDDDASLADLAEEYSVGRSTIHHPPHHQQRHPASDLMLSYSRLDTPN